MSAAWIGIKLADSKFFPVMEEGAPVSKVLELTTVRDDQTSVQINLFRSEDSSIDTAAYVGTLIIEDIAGKKAGEPTIELTLSLDGDNELSAEAVDLESGSRQALSVSLETLSSEDQLGLPDFDLTPIDTTISLGDDPDHRNLVLDSDIPGNAPEGLYEMTTEEETKKSGVFLPAWLCVVILVLGVAALALALIVSARVMRLDRAAGTADQTVAASQVVPATEPDPESAPAVAEETPPPVETEEVPVATPVEEEIVVPAEPEPAPASAVQYKIVWGDTLWDLADAYYRDPWLYTRIAAHNRIRNPNLIIAGTRIEIPPK